ncbi:MAG: hypothetical protein WCJ63_06440 [Actinomycetes bacterium]
MATATTTKKRPAAKKAAPKRKPAASRAKAQAKPAAPETRADRARQQLERAVVIPVGAALEARDAVTDRVEDLQARFGTTAAAEKQLKLYERRGTKVRKDAERSLKRTRTRVERELKARRRTAEKRVRAERKRFEAEAKDAAARVEAVRNAITQIDLANSTGALQSQVGQVVNTGVTAGTDALRTVRERFNA